MIRTDEDALICDFAETYHVFDYRSLPPKLAATLAAGLDESSRIKRAITGRNMSVDTMLRAVIADRLGVLIWLKTKDGQKGRNRPDSFVDLLNGDRENETEGFDSPEAFEAERKRIIGGG